MSGINFETTGDTRVDQFMGLLRMATGAYHNCNRWYDDPDVGDDKCFVDRLDDAAARLARDYAALEAKAEGLKVAANWVLHVESGIGKGGGPPDDQEYIDSLNALKDAITGSVEVLHIGTGWSNPDGTNVFRKGVYQLRDDDVGMDTPVRVLVLADTPKGG